jgi:hypothetical protein
VRSGLVRTVAAQRPGAGYSRARLARLLYFAAVQPARQPPAAVEQRIQTVSIGGVHTFEARSTLGYAQHSDFI